MGNTPSSTASQQFFHVVRVSSDSPASDAGIEPFFDFIIGIEGIAIELGAGAETLHRIVDEYEGQSVLLQVWSSKRQEIRDVRLTPSRSWSLPPSSFSASSTPATPPSGSKPSLLGLTLRACPADRALSSALDQVWHILEVLEGSPAESAGLVPYGDWVIGWPGGVLRQESDFYELVEKHIDRPLRLYVYSYDFDTLREVVLVPNRQWGGEGLLGCGVGYGLLHRIPKPQDRPEPFFHHVDDPPAGADDAPAAVGLPPLPAGKGLVVE